jgi:Flp pilus assembly pilin Flp
VVAWRILDTKPGHRCEAYHPKGAQRGLLWMTVSKCAHVARRFLGDERGAELVEWSVLTVVVVIVGYAILVAVREEVSAVFTRLLFRFFH